MSDTAAIFARYFSQIAGMSPAMLGLFVIALWFGIVTFVRTSDRRRRIAVLLAWCFPGAGHLYLGLRRRGFFLMALLLVTFIAGMVLADFRNISPFERHPIWGVAHFFGGLMALIPAVVTLGWPIEHDLSTYGTGCLYSAVATLLNILLILDVWDRAKEEPIRTDSAALEEAGT